MNSPQLQAWPANLCPECKVDEAADSHDENCCVAAGDHCVHQPWRPDDDDWSIDDDYCVHCECCCTCLGCEYGPRDATPMHPTGLAEVADAEHLETEAFRRGFEAGELNAHLRVAEPDRSPRSVNDARHIVLLACGHWIQPEVVDPGTRTWLCPFGDLTQPAARGGEAGTPAVIGSWDYA